jgi:tetratricopeptide (TPR) repeat protein
VAHPEETLGILLSKFDHCVKTYVKVNAIYLGLFATELLCLIVFLSFLMKSAYFALALAVFFLTLFSFFLFRAYYQALKHDQFDTMINAWMQGMQSPHYDSRRMAEELSSLSDQLVGREKSYYSLPKRLNFLQAFIPKTSFWCHWEDLLSFRELLLQKAVKEYFKILRLQPTHHDVHVHLANTYIKLSSLYRACIYKLNQEKVLYTKKRAEILENKIMIASRKAIEEMKILKEIAPNALDIDLQLAYLYSDLNMTHEETQQYEDIIANNPLHNEALFRLGSLYFQQGLNAKGLQIYQILQQRQVENAETLLKYYGE